MLVEYSINYAFAYVLCCYSSANTCASVLNLTTCSCRLLGLCGSRFRAAQTELAASEAEALKLKEAYESQLDMCIWAKTTSLTLVANRIAFAIAVPHVPTIVQEVNFNFAPGSEVVQSATIVARAISKRRAKHTGASVKNGNLEVVSTRAYGSSNGLPASGSLYGHAQQLSEMLFCKHTGLLAPGRGRIATAVAAVRSYADIPPAMQDIELTVGNAYSLISSVNALWDQYECSVTRGPNGSDTAVLEVVVAAEASEVCQNLMSLAFTIALGQATVTSAVPHMRVQQRGGQLTDAAVQHAVSNSLHCQETGFSRVLGAIQTARELLQLQEA